MTSHAVYSSSFQSILPKNETFYVTILRNTVDTYRSLYRYFHDAVPGMRKTANSIEGFAEYALDPAGYHDDLYHNPDKPLSTNSLWFFGRNAAMWDLGYNQFAMDEHLAIDVSAIERAVTEILSRFDEILITEHMDEGLILLADRLCWNLDDIIEFRQNIELNKDDMSKVSALAQ